MRRFTTALALPAACFTAGAPAQDYHFDAALLGGAVKKSDLALFEQGLQQPGTYRMDVLLNGERVDSQDITLRLLSKPDGRRDLQPCLSTTQLLRWGVKVDTWPGLTQAGGSTTCVRLAAIPQAASSADVTALQLHLDIPQAALQPRYSGLAPEALWDDGITAFLMNYNAGTSRTDGGGAGQSSSWAQLLPGFNAGPWRVRSSWSWQSGGQWQRGYSYAARGLSSLKSRLALGERTTSGEVFDGVPFTGVMLATDESMTPAGERTFSPAVSGVARTRARIEVRQNGYLLKTLQVAPGPFDIQDLPASGGGDLQVTVHETDGHNQFFTVPWQTPAVALHTGYLKYSLAGGYYRAAGTGTVAAPLVQGTAMYGLPHGLTVYGGLQAAAHYNSLSFGLGGSLGRLGAISADTIAARSELSDGSREAGTSWRVRYSSRLDATGTGFSLTSTQHTSPGYRKLVEVMDSWQREGGRYQTVRGGQMRGRSTLTMNQPLGALGSIGLNANRTRLWGDKGSNSGYGISWSTSLRGISVSVSWQQNRLPVSGYRDSTLNMWLSVPLTGGTNASWSLYEPSRGSRRQEAGLSGLGMDDRLSWAVRARYLSDVPVGQRSNSTLHLGWSGTYGQSEADYGYSPSGRNIGAGVSGGVIVHRHGVTLSQPLSETVALVSAPGATGVNVTGWPGVRTDLLGYTAASGMNSYQENTVSLDPTALPDDVEVTQTDVKVVPTVGAVVAAKFSTRTGARAIVTLHHPDGSPVAFAAPVSAEGVEGSVGMVGDGGQAYLSGLPARGTLRVREGAGTCRAGYRLPAEKSLAGLYALSAVCR